MVRWHLFIFVCVTQLVILVNRLSLSCSYILDDTCKDLVACNRYAPEICTDSQYFDWTKTNCPNYCGLCSVTTGSCNLSVIHLYKHLPVEEIFQLLFTILLKNITGASLCFFPIFTRNSDSIFNACSLWNVKILTFWYTRPLNTTKQFTPNMYLVLILITDAFGHLVFKRTFVPWNYQPDIFIQESWILFFFNIFNFLNFVSQFNVSEPFGRGPFHGQWRVYRFNHVCRRQW